MSIQSDVAAYQQHVNDGTSQTHKAFSPGKRQLIPSEIALRNQGSVPKVDTFGATWHGNPGKFE
jgi:hypothetical protein